MTSFNKDKLLFLGMEEEENYMYVVINHTDIDMEYCFIDEFDDAVEHYNKKDKCSTKGKYLKIYKIGYNHFKNFKKQWYENALDEKYKMNN